MKKLFLSILVSTLLATAAMAKDWANFSRYEKANKALTTAPKVVILGDSITDNWAKMRGDFFSKNNFAGRGISGQVSSQMLVRIRADVFALSPKTVVILAGTNDIAKNNGDILLENIVGNIASMVELSQAHGVRAIICSVLPAAKFSWNVKLEPAAQIKKLNSMLAELAKAKGCTFIDFYSPMVDKNGGLPQNLAKDGVHPTSEGYAIMEKILLDTLAKTSKD